MQDYSHASFQHKWHEATSVETPPRPDYQKLIPVTTAATAAAAVTTTAAATATAAEFTARTAITTATAGGTFFFRTGNVDRQSATVELRAVHGGNRLLRFFRGGVRNERETA
jgi:hypothetical protein